MLLLILDVISQQILNATIDRIAGKSTDTTAPTCSITAPANGSSWLLSDVKQGGSSVVVEPADAGGVSRVSILYDGVPAADAYRTSQDIAAGQPTLYARAISDVATLGPHTLTAKVFDIAGNVGTCSINVTIVSTLPSTTPGATIIPTFVCAGSVNGICPTPTTSPLQPTNTQISGTIVPSNITVQPTIDPCRTTQSVAAIRQVTRHHHKNNNGGGGGLFSALLDLLKQLFQLIGQLLSGTPGQPTPTPTPVPTETPSSIPTPSVPCPTATTIPTTMPITPTVTPPVTTATVTPIATVTPTMTPTATPSVTPVLSTQPSSTPTATLTPSPTVLTPTLTPLASATPSLTTTPETTVQPTTITEQPSLAPTATGTPPTTGGNAFSDIIKFILNFIIKLFDLLRRLLGL